MPTSNEPQIQITKKGLRLKIDPKGFLGASVKIGFKKYASGIVDGIKALTIEKPKERIAFLLVFNSFINACRTLIQEASAEYKKVSNQGTKTKGLRVDTTKQLEELELVMTKDFFLKPNTFPFLHQFKPYLEAWLYENEDLDITLEKAYEISKKLPNQFWEELDIEYRENRTEYETLETYFKETPFSKGLEHNRRLTQYYNELLTYYHEPTLNQANLKLSDLYIEPDFHIYEKHFDKKKKEGLVFKNNFLIHQSDIDLHSYLGNLLDHQTPFDLKAEKAQLKLLLGQPGQGKTSFCYRVINDYLESENNSRQLIFLKLKKLANPIDFLSNPFNELKRHFEDIKLDFDFENSFIILDGLDELYQSGGLTNKDINNFLHRFYLELEKRQNTKVLITSRFHYVDLSTMDRDNSLVLSIAPLTTDKQLNWLEKYKASGIGCSFSKKDIKRINENANNQFKELKELITQPILLALVMRTNIKVEEDINKAYIYEQLFDSLIKREWDNSGQLKKFQRLKDRKEDFREYIRDVALAIYQSNQEFISQKTLMNLDSTEEFIENCLEEQEKLEDALKEVLITFYFQEVDNEADQKDTGIEFYHKSLQEYLAAEKIYYTIKDKFLETGNKRKYIIKDWQSALETIWKLVSPKAISHEVAEYLNDIIKNDLEKEQKEKLAERLALFLPDLLDHQFLLNYSADRDQGNPISMACTCFFVYWQILSLSGSNEMITKLILGVNFVSLLKVNQIKNYQRISLIQANLIQANLIQANLSHANLRQANLWEANLWEANLRQANLWQANLWEANLIQANLSQANLSQADLRQADLWQADLKGADLKGADLKGADLKGADLQGAINYTLEQLSETKSLKNCKGIEAEIESKLKELKPELFE